MALIGIDTFADNTGVLAEGHITIEIVMKLEGSIYEIAFLTRIWRIKINEKKNHADLTNKTVLVILNNKSNSNNRKIPSTEPKCQAKMAGR